MIGGPVPGGPGPGDRIRTLTRFRRFDLLAVG
jgi:hypothetical protein